jgi:hypothetical protein
MPQKAPPYDAATLLAQSYQTWPDQLDSESTKAMKATLDRILASESEHRALIRKCNRLASKDIHSAHIAAAALFGLIAEKDSRGGAAIDRPYGMSRGVFRKRTKLAIKLAHACYRLIHSEPIAT